MLRFKHFITEGENSLQLSILKRANNDLYRLVKSAKAFENTAELMKEVITSLAEHDITVLAEDNRKFSGNILSSSGSKKLNIGPSSSRNDRSEFIPYPNVALNVKWTESKKEFILKDCFIS